VTRRTFRRLACGVSSGSEVKSAEAFWTLLASSSTNGSVDSLRGLSHAPVVGMEKAELPQEDKDESEKEEQIELERWNGRVVSLIRSHSWIGLSSWLKSGLTCRGAGVFGGVTARVNGLRMSIGDRRRAERGDCDNIEGLVDCAGTSVISIVGMMPVSESRVSNSSCGIVVLRRRTLKGCARGGGGGPIGDGGASLVWGSGVFGICPRNPHCCSSWSGRVIDSDGRCEAMARFQRRPKWFIDSLQGLYVRVPLFRLSRCSGAQSAVRDRQLRCGCSSKRQLHSQGSHDVAQSIAMSTRCTVGVGSMNA
jgi:hypothetical protein